MRSLFFLSEESTRDRHNNLPEDTFDTEVVVVIADPLACVGVGAGK